MSQLNRVIAVMCDGKERTLRQIEAAIFECDRALHQTPEVHNPSAHKSLS